MVGLSNVMDFVRAKTQGDLMLAAGSTPEKVKVAEKMGLLKPSQPLVSEISKTKLLFDTKDYVEQVTRENGLTSAGAVADKMRKGTNSGVQVFMEDMGAEFASTTKYDGFLKAIGDRAKADPGFIDQIGQELKDPAAQKSFEDALRNDPTKIQKLIETYKPGQLASLGVIAPVTQTSAMPSTPQTVTAAPTTVSAPPTAVSPVSTAAAPTTAAQPSQAAPAPTVAPASQAMDTKQEMSGLAAGFSELIASMTNEELREGISPKFVESLAGGMALNANKMGVSEADTQAFVDRISGDPKLQEAIAANLKENPGFIRRMAKASQDSGTDTQDLFKDMARSEMEKLMANPELLANKGYVKKLDDGLKLRDGLGKLMDENGPLGKLWKGIKEFLDIDGMPSFGGMDFMGMIKDLINGIAKMFGLPQIVAGNSTTPMHPQLTSQLERSSMLAVKGPDGKFTHDVHQGRQMVKVPNTISVQNENGEMIDVIPTEGAKLIAKSSTGAVTLRVAQSINSDGTVKSVKTVNLSKEGYESYERQLKERGATIATQDVSQRPKVETVRLDHKTGAEIPTPDAKPNDLDLTRKLAQNPNAPMADMGLDMGMTSG